MQPMIDDQRPARQAAELQAHEHEVERLREALMAYYVCGERCHHQYRMTLVSLTLAETVDNALSQAQSLDEARQMLRNARAYVARQIRLREV
ncbi:hypothetical protein [Halorhodospira sp. 9622]|uniref:hypothetical protein n=1 Tax=Halorhodospira sp. 9622 TaxID=2899136 RepID=UPI001EE901DC|nr:hypothetical protein [Halorhodospira sp. 9622]MCG5538987.1 hypothetical protein [Halorhodospira sp. 9622]